MALIEGENLCIGIPEPLAGEQSDGDAFASTCRPDEKRVSHILKVQIKPKRSAATRRSMNERWGVRWHQRRWVYTLTRPDSGNWHEVYKVPRMCHWTPNLRRAVAGHCSKESIDGVHGFEPNSKTAVDEHLAKFPNHRFDELQILVLEHNRRRKISVLDLTRCCLRHRPFRIRRHLDRMQIRSSAVGLENLILETAG